MAFGKAEDPPPRLDRLRLAPLVEDVLESEKLAGGDTQIAYVAEVAPTLHLRADGEQLFRVLGNLVRNARQALEAASKPGVIEVTAAETVNNGQSGVCIRIGDSGPGLPPKAREHLFEAFQGGARAKAVLGWAWPSPPNWCAVMAGSWNWCDRIRTERNSESGCQTMRDRFFDVFAEKPCPPPLANPGPGR